MAEITDGRVWNPRHDHDICIDDAVEAAARVCEERGVRLTDLRRRVLELVWDSHKPVGAYAVLEQLQGERAGAQPPTVYRALDFLTDQGLVHRIQSLNAYVGCAHPEHPHRGMFLICGECGDAMEVEDTGIDRAIYRTAQRVEFDVQGCTLEATGLCHRCQE